MASHDNSGPSHDRRDHQRGAEFRIGSVLTRAFRAYRAGFVPFAAMTFIVALPNLLVLLPSAVPAVSVPIKSLIAITLDLYLNTIGQTIILFAALQELRGEQVGLGEAVQKTLSRFFPLVGVATLYWLGTLAGLVLLVVPGIFLAIMWTVAPAACAVEGIGPIDGLRRSARLTGGQRWKIFGIVALMMIVSIGGDQLIALFSRPAGTLAQASGAMIWAAVSGAYWNCAFAVIYIGLCAGDGTDAGQIAAVFD